MKKPLQATLTTPPAVEYVAVERGDAWVVGGLAGRVVGGADGGLAAVVGGEAGATVTPGAGACGGGAAGTGGVGLAGAAPRPRDGTVEGGTPAFGMVLVGAVLAVDVPDSSSLTTSW